jgi:hypothetical protein
MVKQQAAMHITPFPRHPQSPASQKIVQAPAPHYYADAKYLLSILLCNNPHKTDYQKNMSEPFQDQALKAMIYMGAQK